MQKFGWQFQAAMKIFNKDRAYSTVLEIFVDHFTRFHDPESAKKILNCCRCLKDYQRGYALLRENPWLENYTELTEEIFLFRYSHDIVDQMRNGKWMCVESALSCLVQSPEIIPERLLGKVKIDRVLANVNCNDWQRAYEALCDLNIDDTNRTENYSILKRLRRKIYRALIIEQIEARRYQKALDFASEALKFSPFDEWYKMREVECLVKFGELESAIELMQEFSTKHTSSRFHYRLSQYALVAGQKSLSAQQAMIAVAREKNHINKPELLAHVARLFRLFRMIDCADVALVCSVRSHEIKGRVVPAQLFKEFQQIQSGWVNESVDVLLLLVRTWCTGMIAYDFSTRKRRSYQGIVNYEWKDPYFVKIECEDFSATNIIYPRIKLSPDISERGGGVLFNVPADDFEMAPEGCLLASDVVSDTIANRNSQLLRERPLFITLG